MSQTNHPGSDSRLSRDATKQRFRRQIFQKTTVSAVWCGGLIDSHWMISESGTLLTARLLPYLHPWMVAKVPRDVGLDSWLFVHLAWKAMPGPTTMLTRFTSILGHKTTRQTRSHSSDCSFHEWNDWTIQQRMASRTFMHLSDTLD